MTITFQSPPKSILLISTLRFGDGLLFTPVVRSVRLAYPEARIDVLVSREGHLVFNDNPDVDNVLYISKRPSVLEYLKFIAKHWRKYDLVLNDRVSDKPALYAWVTGKQRAGFVDSQASNARTLKRLYTDWVEEPQSPTHRVNRNLALTTLLDIEPCTDIVAPQSDKPLPLKLPEPYVVVHMPSSSEFKQWPVRHWQTLTQKLIDAGFYLVFTGSKSERDQAIINEVIATLGTDSNRWFNASTSLSLTQTAQLLKQSLGFIGPDCGPAHLASAFNIPQIVLFGPTPPCTWAPWPYQHPLESTPYDSERREQTVGNITVIQAKLDCVPCYAKQCKLTKSLRPECMSQIEPERVMAAISRILSRDAEQSAIG